MGRFKCLSGHLSCDLGCRILEIISAASFTNPLAGPISPHIMGATIALDTELRLGLGRSRNDSGPFLERFSLEFSRRFPACRGAVDSDRFLNRGVRDFIFACLVRLFNSLHGNGAGPPPFRASALVLRSRSAILRGADITGFRHQTN